MSTACRFGLCRTSQQQSLVLTDRAMVVAVPAAVAAVAVALLVLQRKEVNGANLVCSIKRVFRTRRVSARSGRTEAG
eukprot:COSAG06_NODE_23883_length_678_cov_15456.856649_1_plen_76_part_10